MNAAPIRVLVSGHDAGGLNLLVPLLRAWSDGTVVAAEFVGGGTSLRELDARLPEIALVKHVVDAEHLSNAPHLDAFLDGLIARVGCDGVLTATSSANPLERRLILAAVRSAVPAIAFCDMWWAMDARFREPEAVARPNELWLVDPIPDGAEPAPWATPPALRVVGHPLYAQRIAQGGVGKAPAGRGARRTVRFLSEPASTRFPGAGIDEFAVAELALAAVHAVDPAAPFVVRPHPMEAIEPWRRWCWARRNEAVGLDVEPLESCFATTARAIGIASSLLVEMRLAGIPSAVLRTSGADRAYYALPFAQMGVAVISDRDAMECWLRTDDELALPASAVHHRGAIERATALLVARLRAVAPVGP